MSLPKRNFGLLFFPKLCAYYLVNTYTILNSGKKLLITSVRYNIATELAKLHCSRTENNKSIDTRVHKVKMKTR